MDDFFKIYVDQLRDGHVEHIDLMFTPNVISIKEEDLTFEDDVKVKGEAYLANEELVLHLDLSTFAEIPCRVCNQIQRVDVNVFGLYHVVPLADVKGGIYNMSGIIRESVLLECPRFVECNHSNCPNRKKFAKYFKEEKSEKNADEDGHQPFKNISF